MIIFFLLLHIGNDCISLLSAKSLFSEYEVIPKFALSLKTQEKLLCLSQPEHVTVAIEKVRKKTRILTEREQSEVRQKVTLHFVSYLRTIFILFNGYPTLSITYDPILKDQGITLLLSQ